MFALGSALGLLGLVGLYQLTENWQIQNKVEALISHTAVHVIILSFLQTPSVHRYIHKLEHLLNRWIRIDLLSYDLGLGAFRSLWLRSSFYRALVGLMQVLSSGLAIESFGPAIASVNGLNLLYLVEIATLVVVNVFYTAERFDIEHQHSHQCKHKHNFETTDYYYYSRIIPVTFFGLITTLGLLSSLVQDLGLSNSYLVETAAIVALVALGRSTISMKLSRVELLLTVLHTLKMGLLCMIPSLRLSSFIGLMAFEESLELTSSVLRLLYDTKYGLSWYRSLNRNIVSHIPGFLIAMFFMLLAHVLEHILKVYFYIDWLFFLKCTVELLIYNYRSLKEVKHR